MRRHSMAEEAMVQLTKHEQAQYERDGFVFPLRAFDDAEIASFKTRLDGVIAREGGELSKRTNQKPHLLLPFLNEMMRDPRILDAVEGAIGPNILAWASGFFIKQPSSKSFISWHQDSTYWGLSSPDVITAWIAFTPSIPLSGCMRVVAGSHLRDQIPHRDTHAAENMLSRGQEVAVEVDEKQAVDIV
ncbi:MAG: phytanoyl-CoA dioxygenase family protein, partial [Alphaproteobacteria bacterium]|nr:phytanoyl-CoA dioxygenase family protein [Alphaproteobacteria bacterium]